MKKETFTLLELLVVIGIIAVLAALLLPTLNSARVHARKTDDINNLKQIYIAIQCYCDDYNGYFPFVEDIADTGECSKTLWLLLPYINFNTKVLSPAVEEMAGNRIYAAVTSDNPSSVPNPGFAYTPLYTTCDSSIVDSPLHIAMQDMEKVPVVVTFSDKYNKNLNLLFTGSVQ